MIHLRSVEGPTAIHEAAKPLPFGPGLAGHLDGVTWLEIWGTGWKDAEDYTEFRVYAGNDLLHTIRAAGY